MVCIAAEYLAFPTSEPSVQLDRPLKDGFTVAAEIRRSTLYASSLGAKAAGNA